MSSGTVDIQSASQALMTTTCFDKRFLVHIIVGGAYRYRYMHAP